MRVTNERRADPRAPLTESVVIFSGDQRLRGRAVDISAGGVALELSTAPAQPFVRVNFRLSPDDAWVDADAMVARSANSRYGHLIGLRFLTLHPATKARISGFVDSVKTRNARAKQARMVSGRFRRSPNTRTTEKLPAVGAAVAPDRSPLLPKKRDTAVPKPRVQRSRKTPTDRELGPLYAAAVEDVTAGPPGKKRRR